MRLSEAILLGSTMKPQATGSFLSPGGATCALGAALDAMGCIDRDTVDYAVRNLTAHWPWSMEEAGSPNCPLCGGVGSIAGQILHLNDNHQWTREQIAEWVATVEPKEPVEEMHEDSSALDSLPHLP